MSQVENFGGNTTAVSTGTTSFIWNDANNDGVLNKNDVVVVADQDGNDASVLSYVVGNGEAMFSWGDPHLDNMTFKAGGEAAFTGSLRALFRDAKDGTLDDSSLTTAVVDARHTYGQRSNIGDYHADMTLVLLSLT